MEKLINVAPSSIEGHFLKDYENVINLEDSLESFVVKVKDGSSAKLKTKNHTTLEIDRSCLINCQVVVNPFTGLYEKSKD